MGSHGTAWVVGPESEEGKMGSKQCRKKFEGLPSTPWEESMMVVFTRQTASSSCSLLTSRSFSLISCQVQN